MYYIQLRSLDGEWRAIDSKEVKRLACIVDDPDTVSISSLSQSQAELAAVKLREMDSTVPFRVVRIDEFDPSEGFIPSWQPLPK